ncbi:50S ribosomal protein L17 [Dissulfurirhabdus thermomarina]|uniref:Large ribosomal subunit protein bL17 n=1 Tax=Dissulfurirhabdus thermomarina TaxID=1765737 RepID=A0A6N9TJB0_DISTH|nr:50S ribosomal protein L17 [Dissulfurirhabdus thermomarina]NDY41335.1 50S ribosomal protein L17 [Dissulfurirhabdus thermomarina]NMX23282.1 50S ribosomal protein L17 [Dissulfurirhabdus thermomarina]
MRHRRRTRRLGRSMAHREAMLRNMVTSLLEHGRVVTTVTRAKELRRVADRMVTLAKDGGLHARRQAQAVVRDKDVVARLFGEWRQQMADRSGGYTRVIRLGPRRGDAAMTAVVEMVTEPLEKPTKKKARSKKGGGGQRARKAAVEAAAPVEGESSSPEAAAPAEEATAPEAEAPAKEDTPPEEPAE